ncbi:hypothetical protein M422DRAFT_180452, partial [Sphaerobolus stellatus SS14]
GLTMLHDGVTSGDITRIVARATRIPVQSLLRGEGEKLTQLFITGSRPQRMHHRSQSCFQCRRHLARIPYASSS